MSKAALEAVTYWKQFFTLRLAKILILNLLPTPTLSVGVGSIFSAVCLFVRNITQKRMIPKCSNLV